MNHVGEEIRNKRKQLHLTQADVAGDQMSVSKLSNIENGKILPDPQAWLYLREKLGLSERFTKKKRTVEKIYFLMEQAGTYESADLETKAVDAYGDASELALEFMLFNQAGTAYMKRAALLIKQRRYKEAEDCLDKSLHCFDNEDEWEQLVEVELLYTRMFYQEDKYSRALEFAVQAVARVPDGETKMRGAALLRIAEVMYKMQRYDEANLHCERALSFLSEEDGDYYVEALILLGMLLRKGHLYCLSRDYTEKAKAIAGKQKKTYYMGICLHNLGNLSMEEGDFEQSIKYYRLACEVKELAENQPGIIKTKIDTAELHYRKRELDEAKRFGQEALQMAREQHRRTDELHATWMLSKISEAEGNEQKFLDFLFKAMTLADVLELNVAKSKLLGHLADYHAGKGERERCMEKLYEARLYQDKKVVTLN